MLVVTLQTWVALLAYVRINALAPGFVEGKPVYSNDTTHSVLCRQAEGTRQHRARQVWHVLGQLQG